MKKSEISNDTKINKSYSTVSLEMLILLYLYYE